MFTLDTGYLFPETYALWERLEARYGIRFRARRTACRAVEPARRRPGRPTRTPAARRARWCRSAPSSAGLDAWVTGDPPRPDARPRQRAGRRVGRPLRAREGEPARRVDQRGRLGARARARRADEPAPRAGLHEHRLRARAPRRSGRARTRAPAAGAGARRPSAACTSGPSPRQRKDPRRMSARAPPRAPGRRARRARRPAGLRPLHRLHRALPVPGRAGAALDAGLPVEHALLGGAWRVVASPRALASYRLSFGASLVAAA